MTTAPRFALPTRWARRVAASLVVAGLACSVPTDLCGCSPARTVVFVVGSLRDAAGAPVVGARIYLDGVPPSYVSEYTRSLSGPSDGQTDAAGAFRGFAFSLGGPGTYELRVGVVRPDVGDSIRLTAGPVRFGDTSARLDTVRVALRLP